MITLTGVIVFLINLLVFAFGVVLVAWVFHMIIGWLATSGFVAIPAQVVQILSAIFGLIVLLYFIRMVLSGAYLILI